MRFPSVLRNLIPNRGHETVLDSQDLDEAKTSMIKNSGLLTHKNSNIKLGDLNQKLYRALYLEKTLLKIPEGVDEPYQDRKARMQGKMLLQDHSFSETQDQQHFTMQACLDLIDRSGNIRLYSANQKNLPPFELSRLSNVDYVLPTSAYFVPMPDGEISRSSFIDLEVTENNGKPRMKLNYHVASDLGSNVLDDPMAGCHMRIDNKYSLAINVEDRKRLSISTKKVSPLVSSYEFSIDTSPMI